jgi:hypothetical protein
MKEEERQGVITMQGKAATLLGRGVRAGDKASDFWAVY